MYDTDNMDADDQVCITTQHTARKSRPCASCPALIEPGQRYNRHFFPPATVYIEHADPVVCYFSDPEPADPGTDANA
jgi:hypothetical protein